MNRKWWKAILCLMCVVFAFSFPQKAVAAGDKKSAGAAVLLDVDVSMKDEEIVELVKTNTTQTIEIKKLEKEQTDLVMAKVNRYVNIRSEATQDSEKLGVLYKDCGGHILERGDGWTKIQSGKVTGWVKDEYLYFDSDAVELAKEVGILIATSKTDALRVRKEPSTAQGTGVWGLLATGESLEAIEELGEWVSVSYEGSTGYVKSEYVSIDFQIDQAESIEEIKEREAKEAEAKRNAMKEKVMATADEVDILAALIQCEAGGEPYEGQIAVGAVVMNRVRSAAYPNSIKDVIYASGQFTPAGSTKMSTLVLTGNIYASCRKAAQDVINGTCNVGDLTHFRRKGNKEGLIIGNHVFY